MAGPGDRGLRASGPLRRVVRTPLWWIAGLAWAAAAFVVADTVATVIVEQHPMPFADQWGTAAELVRIERQGLDPLRLLDQHNEHRLAVPRLIFYADAYLMGAQGGGVLALILLVQALHVFLLVALARGAGVPGGPRLAVLAALATALLFHGRQIENFVWVFQIQFVGVFLAASAAFWSLARAATGRPLRWAVAAALAACVATLSMANGLLAFLVLPVLALALGLGRGLALALGAVAVVVATLFVATFTPVPYHPDPLSLSARLPALAGAICAYIGNMAAPFGSAAARWAGFLGLILGAAATVATLRRRDGPPHRLALLAVLAFVAGSAVLTGIGRAGMGGEPGMAGRYAAGSALWWAALAALLLSLRTGRAAVVVPGLAAATLALAVLQPGEAAQYGWLRAAKERATLPFIVGAPAPAPFLTVTAGSPDVPMFVWPVYRARRWGPMADPRADLYGRNVAELNPLTASDACLGSFDVAEPYPPMRGRAGAFVAGWAADRATGAPARSILIADTAGRVVGFADGRRGRDDVVAAVPVVADRMVGWEGHAGYGAAKTLTAYAVLGSGRACPLPTTHAVPGPGPG